MSPRYRRLILTVLTLLYLSGATIPATAYAGGYPRDEFEFCPAGGPLGWLNYFDRRDREKRWKNYWRYQNHMQSRAPAYGPSYLHHQVTPVGNPPPRYQPPR